MEPSNSTPLFPQPTLFSSEYMSKLRNNAAGTIGFCSLEPNSQPVGTRSKTPGSSSNDHFQASGTTSTSFNFNTLPPLGLGQSSHINFGQLSTIIREFSEPSGALSRLETANPVIPSAATPFSIVSSSNPTIKSEFSEPSWVPTGSETANPRILSVASPFSSYSPSNSTAFSIFAPAAPKPFAPTAFGLFAPFSQSNAQIKPEPNGSSALPAITEGTLQLPKPSLKFDQNGDLQLFVGTNDAKKEMLVDSRALCRASPILRKKLAETKSEGGHWHLKFPDDQAEAFSILMDMVHGQFILTPKYPSIEQLYQVVFLANKYDMFQTL